MSPQDGVFDEFCARFPYEETDDQLQAIGDVLEDLSAGKPMDRLICGDVGFGKTEVALRAAFVVAMRGKQVAVVAPTTLLARQHSRPSSSASRAGRCGSAGCRGWCPPRRPKETKAALKDGEVEIVVGTHAVLSKSIGFKNLGLVIVDEEQHFGVEPQGAAEGASRRRARADADRDADPAHPADGADRHPRDEHHRHAAGRPPGGAHLRDAVGRRHDPRGAAARAVSRRPGLLCLPAHRGPRRGRRGDLRELVPEMRMVDGARPHAADPAREHDAGLRRRQVRRAAVDQHRRDRASTSATPTP